MRSLILVVAVACGGPSSSAPLAGRAATTAPSGPAPKVEWQEHRFAAIGLPAVSRDGSVVVLAIQEEDGARGFPNLAIVVKNRRDAVVKTIPVMTSDEAEKLVGETASPALQTRITGANRALGELHAAHDLVALDRLDVDDSVAPQQRHVAEAKDLTIDWVPSRLAIRRAGRPVLDVETPAGWLVKDSKMCPNGGCTEMCHNPAFLNGAVASTDRAIAVLTISYIGTDTCWEPSSQHHVVAW
jgi:hypothetical protein